MNGFAYARGVPRTSNNRFDFVDDPDYNPDPVYGLWSRSHGFVWNFYQRCISSQGPIDKLNFVSDPDYDPAPGSRLRSYIWRRLAVLDWMSTFSIILTLMCFSTKPTTNRPTGRAHSVDYIIFFSCFFSSCLFLKKFLASIVEHV